MRQLETSSRRSASSRISAAMPPLGGSRQVSEAAESTPTTNKSMSQMSGFSPTSRAAVQPGGAAAAKKHHDPVLAGALTPTTCFCGLFTADVAVQVIAFFSMLEGMCMVGVWLDDRLTGAPVFRWGPPLYEKWLQGASAFVGFLAIIFGVVGFRASKHLAVKPIARMVKFWKLQVVFTIVWFLLVGMPTDIVHTTIAPKFPGGESHTIIDPMWPNGKPHVCTDLYDIKQRLAATLNEKQSNPVVGALVEKIVREVLQKAIPCQVEFRMFWAAMLAWLAIKMYAFCIVEFFYKVVLHGGDGRVMLGDLKDLDRPMHDRKQSLQAMLKSQVHSMFTAMDADKDGRVSMDEMLGYLSQSSTLYRPLSEPGSTEGVGA